MGAELLGLRKNVASALQSSSTNDTHTTKSDLSENVKHQILETIASMADILTWTYDKPPQVNIEKGDYFALGNREGWEIFAFVPNQGNDVGKYYPARAKKRGRFLAQWLPSPFVIPKDSQAITSFESTPSIKGNVVALPSSENTAAQKATKKLSESLQNATQAVDAVREVSGSSNLEQAALALKESIQKVIDRPKTPPVELKHEDRLDPERDIMVLGDGIAVTFPGSPQYLYSRFKKMVQGHLDKIDEQRKEQGKEPFGAIPLQILFHK